MFIRRNGLEKQPRNYSPNGELDIRKTEKILRDVGCSRKQAKSIIAIGYDATAAMNGWQVDQRDAGSTLTMSQPPQPRDVVAPGAQDIMENLMIRIRKLT